MSGHNAVRVAVPVKLARLRVWVDKGRHWSGVDRLILWALAVEPSTAGELAKVARMPARLITEVILRMMRFGWVELAAAPKGASFRTTDAGREVVETFEIAARDSTGGAKDLVLNGTTYMARLRFARPEAISSLGDRNHRT
jgi:hypothetical protein